RHGLVPGAGEIVVTGAAGGVGSVAIALLARSGYPVGASSGRSEATDYLHELGAATVIDPAALAAPPQRPLVSGRWAGGVQGVGGTALGTPLTGMRFRSSVAACGLAGGSSLETTVMPFIIRGVKLLGIDSVMAPLFERRDAWNRLARD